MQAAAGFVVVMSNPRGGSGRDTAWGQAIMGPKHPTVAGAGWGSVDVDDVMAVLDATLARYRFCDADRVGMLGGSYGGYMATMLAGRYSDRFRAICSERAVNNLVSEEWSSDIATAFRVDHGPTHIEDPDEYARMSPIRFVRDIDVPMLHPALRERPALPDRPGRGAVRRPPPPRQGRDVLPLPGGEPRALAVGLAGPPPDARRDHPRLLHREDAAPPAPARPPAADAPRVAVCAPVSTALFSAQATASDAGAVASAPDPGRSSVPPGRGHRRRGAVMTLELTSTRRTSRPAAEDGAPSGHRRQGGHRPDRRRAVHRPRRRRRPLLGQRDPPPRRGPRRRALRPHRARHGDRLPPPPGPQVLRRPATGQARPRGAGVDGLRGRPDRLGRHPPPAPRVRRRAGRSPLAAPPRAGRRRSAARAVARPRRLAVHGHAARRPSATPPTC